MSEASEDEAFVARFAKMVEREIDNSFDSRLARLIWNNPSATIPTDTRPWSIMTQTGYDLKLLNLRVDYAITEADKDPENIDRWRDVVVAHQGLAEALPEGFKRDLANEGVRLAATRVNNLTPVYVHEPEDIELGHYLQKRDDESTRVKVWARGIHEMYGRFHIVNAAGVERRDVPWTEFEGWRVVK